MRARKIHFTPGGPRGAQPVQLVNIISDYCGSSVGWHWSRPKQHVSETGDPFWVSCKKCLDRMTREGRNG